MTAQRRNKARAQQPDPLSGDFSQARAGALKPALPVLQWLGAQGLPKPLDKGGWFIEGKHLAELDDSSPPAPFKRVTVSFPKGPQAGWAAPSLSLALVLDSFGWELKSGQGPLFPPDEWQKRKDRLRGEEKQLRGRTRALVAIKELEEWLSGSGLGPFPLMLSVRGKYSAALNSVLREALKLSAAATRLRAEAGLGGEVPREAFWLTIGPGPLTKVGEPPNTSLIYLPCCDLPEEPSREELISLLVPPDYRKPGGSFDSWAEAYGELFKGSPVPPHPLEDRASPDQKARAMRLTRLCWPGDPDPEGRLNAVAQHYLGSPFDELPQPEAERVIAWLGKKSQAVAQDQPSNYVGTL